MIQAFKGLIRQILSESDERIKAFGKQNFWKP